MQGGFVSETLPSKVLARAFQGTVLKVVVGA